MVSEIAGEHRFKGAYGTDAVISVYRDGTARLRMSGARTAMGEMGDWWREVSVEKM